MLRELHISNVAVIADTAVEFAPGLNVLTGPTGAGKSLVIGAIEILLGLRAPARLLREGAGEGRVTGVFQLDGEALRSDLSVILDAALPEDELHLVRRVLPTGRTTASVNGQPVPATVLKRLGERLIDIHGQHDQQFLLRPANQLALLDDLALKCAGTSGGTREKTSTMDRHSTVLRAVAEAHATWRAAVARREALVADARRRAERIELLTFQARDIDETAPKPGELDAVDARHKLLSQLDHITTVAGAACSALSEGDSAIADQLAKLAQRLGELEEADPAIAPMAESLRGAAVSAREAARDLLAHIASLDADAGELSMLDSRLAALRRLTARYGPTLEEVLRYRAGIKSELEALRRQDDESASADEGVRHTAEAYATAAARLTQARRGATARLVPAVSAQLGELGLERASFDIAFQVAEPSASGNDGVEFMVRTNPGQPVRPLREIASSGEMNRIMLALKSVAAGSDRCSVLVFDEVDANVGGRMGAVIGRKLRGLAGAPRFAGHGAAARTHGTRPAADGAHAQQVLCITHLPQIAAFADRHLRVDKQISRGQTRTLVRVLNGEERVEELAEMIAGRDVSDITRQQARNLLEEAHAREMSVRRGVRITGGVRRRTGT